MDQYEFRTLLLELFYLVGMVVVIVCVVLMFLL